MNEGCNWSDWSFFVGLSLGGLAVATAWLIYMLDIGRRPRWLDPRDRNADN